MDPNVTIFQAIAEYLTVDSKTGVGYCSIRGAAQLIGIDQSGLSKLFKTTQKGEEIKYSELAKTLIQQ
ncbi:MAG: hypothetical protein F6J98_02075 [Moorea sp. SIO4G2]|nr:hypothetical protein [Moorena sp. SIO4G2]